MYRSNVVSNLKVSDQNSESENAPTREYGPFRSFKIRITRGRIFLPFKRQLPNFKGNLGRENCKENAHFPRKLIVCGGAVILVVIVVYLILHYICLTPVVLRKIPGPIFRVKYSEIAVSRVNSLPGAIRPGFSAFGGSLAIENPWGSFYPFNTQALYQVHLLEMTAIGDYKRNASLSMSAPRYYLSTIFK